MARLIQRAPAREVLTEQLHAHRLKRMAADALGPRASRLVNVAGDVIGVSFHEARRPATIGDAGKQPNRLARVVATMGVNAVRIPPLTWTRDANRVWRHPPTGSTRQLNAHRVHAAPGPLRVSLMPPPFSGANTRPHAARASAGSWRSSRMPSCGRWTCCRGGAGAMVLQS